MTTLTGIGIGRGIVVGPVLRMPDPLPEPSTMPSTIGPDSERERATGALAAAGEDIRARGEKSGGKAQEVLEAQALMADDPTLRSEIDSKIDGGATAERAVFEAFDGFREMLVGLGGYMAERAADLDDVAQRIIARLTGVAAPGVPESDTPFVLVARDLAPADTALLDLDKVLAVVTSDGGPTSHTAILAREKSITAIVGVSGALGLADGDLLIVDAGAGEIVVDPTLEDLAAAEAAIGAQDKRGDVPIGPGRLADGTHIPLLANLGSVDGIEKAVEAGAEGVGLFRTEFLFLDATSAPSVAAQYAQYSKLLRGFPGKKVVVRALDAGADKPLSFLNDAKEENPALGLRGLRALRATEQILRDQLTALVRAESETDADLWVMAPMVSTAEETTWFVNLANEIGIKTAGIMVEVPSAAILADRVLRDAAFASIGTNDLTQYTLAADRLLGTVSSFQDPWHPAVLTLIAEVGRAGAALGKPVGICGEAAADPLLAVVLVGLGATSLSMSPSAIGDVRAELAQHTREEAQRLAAEALGADSAKGAREAVRAALALHN
ncbi:phosphoenolpyruvate--protein phosphotransferase [Amnibacterium flavum]|uniref:Phosphoenolpyruvate-protein phosphotransferase n=1 Tax=Amnibacterium flavum TaxID=2173173 RepID=A0A2V1HVH8_9MICO|nr:phosphoenolpyruvate--protein phosphotransferase [Amnibacterium flavum]PVZ95079.1 phosphoenolpyruvate--protein phosphotransferase [Amnibacterium flavum]